MLVSLVYLVAEVNAGASDDLGDNDTLCAVDDEGAAVGHEREIAHEDLLLLDLVRLLVVQAHANLDGLGVRRVALLAFLHGILGRLVHGVVEEAQLEIAGVVGNGIDVAEHLAQPLAQEPLIGILLDLEHIRQLQDLILLREALAGRLAHHDILCDRHVKSSQPFCSCLMTRLVALFISFLFCLRMRSCDAIITTDSGENCEWPYAGIMDLHSISFCLECQFIRPIFVNYFLLTTGASKRMRRFFAVHIYKNAADALRSRLKQVTQPKQYVQRAEAVGHEQLLPRDLPPEAIRQDENFGKIRARAEKICRCAQQLVDIRQRKRGEEQNSRRACREVARDEQDMLPPGLLRRLLLHDGVNRVLFLHAASPML